MRIRVASHTALDEPVIFINDKRVSMAAMSISLADRDVESITLERNGCSVDIELVEKPKAGLRIYGPPDADCAKRPPEQSALDGLASPSNRP